MLDAQQCEQAGVGSQGWFWFDKEISDVCDVEVWTVLTDATYTMYCIMIFVFHDACRIVR